jgi:hypothetical protein
MPCLVANCAVVSSPRRASRATFALNCAEYRFRLLVIQVRPSQEQTELNLLSKFWGPAQITRYCVPGFDAAHAHKLRQNLSFCSDMHPFPGGRRSFVSIDPIEATPGWLRSSLIAGTPSSAKVSGLDRLVTIRLAATHCLGGSFLPVDGMPSQILGRRSRSRPAAAKRAANGGGLEGDRRPRNNAMTIGRPQNAGQYPSRQFPISTAQDIFGSPAE